MEINKPEGGNPVARKFQELKESFSKNNNGHRYMMIKNGEMHLTDKKNRSSLSEINKFMESVFKDETLSNEEKLAILSSYHTLTKKFEKKELTGIKKYFLRIKKRIKLKKTRPKLHY